MEAWVIGCIVFVFAALMEYTGILLKMKLRKLYSFRRKKDTYAWVKRIFLYIYNFILYRYILFVKLFRITDLTFLILFPFLFLIFNLLYWSAVHYTRWGNNDFIYCILLLNQNVLQAVKNAKNTMEYNFRSIEQNSMFLSDQ